MSSENSLLSITQNKITNYLKEKEELNEINTDFDVNQTEEKQDLVHILYDEATPVNMDQYNFLINSAQQQKSKYKTIKTYQTIKLKDSND